jgi:hypothetical protein
MAGGDESTVTNMMCLAACGMTGIVCLCWQLGSANRGALINSPSNTPGLLFGIRLGQTHTLTSEMYFVRRGRNRARKGAESPVTSFLSLNLISCLLTSAAPISHSLLDQPAAHAEDASPPIPFQFDPLHLRLLVPHFISYYDMPTVTLLYLDYLIALLLI